MALRCRKQSLGQLKPIGAAGLSERANEVGVFYRTNLMPHFRAEEAILFPLMRERVPESAALIDELVSQHEQLREIVPRLEAASRLAKDMFELGDLLERHIRKEERELFPLFEARVEAAQAEVVGRQLAAILSERQGA